MRRRTPLLVAVAALVLSTGMLGCTAAPQATPQLASTPTPAPLSYLGAPPVPLPVSAVPGIRVVDASGGGDLPVSGRWSYLDGSSPLDAAVDRTVLDAIDRFRGEHGAARFTPRLGRDGIAIAPAGATPPPAASGGLSVDGALVAAAGSMVGIRITTADPGRVASATTFVDGSTGEVVRGPDLLASAALPTAIALLKSAVTTAPVTPGTPVPSASGSPPGVGPATPPLDSAVLADSTFDPHGDLAVAVAAGTFGAPQKETAYLSAAAVAPLLGDFGGRLQRAVLAGSPILRTPGGVSHVPCSLVACVALTYDDGPAPGPTDQLLGILKAEGVPGTFFEVGKSVTAAPDLTRRLIDAGMSIENHTNTHARLPALDAAGILAETTRADDAITAAGAPRPPLMRAPYGATNDLVRGTVGKPLIHWSVDSFDWRSRDPKAFVPLVLRKVAPGGVILMHDIYQSTVDGQRALIEGLRASGYTFVTVSQLFDGLSLQPGAIYACRGTYTPDTGVPCVGP